MTRMASKGRSARFAMWLWVLAGCSASAPIAKEDAGGGDGGSQPSDSGPQLDAYSNGDLDAAALPDAHVPDPCVATGGVPRPEAACGLVCGEEHCEDDLPAAERCDCGPERTFYTGSSGCAPDPNCGFADAETACRETGGSWEPICCHTMCGEFCADPCAAPACNCGPGRNFDEQRGCFEDASCDEGRGEGETCGGSAGGAECGSGLSCCYPCGIPDCEYVCEPTCSPGEPGCVDGCLLRP